MNKLRNIFFLALSFVVFITKTSSFAQVSPPTKKISSFIQRPEVLELKSKLEQNITKNFKDRISTQVELSNFSVSVQISLIEKPLVSVKSEVAKNTDTPSHIDIPADTNLGNIQIDPLFEKMKNELKTTDERSNGLSELFLQTWMRQVEISKINVLIGLDEDLDKNYKIKFGNWIKSTLASEFGSTAKYKLFDIIKVKKVEPPKEQPTIYDQLSRFQVTLGLIFLSLMLIILTLLIKFTTSKDTKERNQTAVQIQEMKLAQMSMLHKSQTNSNLNPWLADSKSKNRPVKQESDDKSNDNIHVIAQAFKDLQFKIGYFLEINTFSPQELKESWFAQGWQGRMKFASLIDAILTYFSINHHGIKSNAEPNNKSHQILHWLSTEKKMLNEDQLAVFQEFPYLSIQERYQILEQTYWDLLSIKMMGTEALTSRFSSLQDLSSDQIQEVLATQDPKLKTIAILHLPQEKIQKLMASLDSGEKQKLLDEGLKIETMSSYDIEVADEALKFAVQKNQDIPNQNGVSFKSLIPNLLSSLSVQDEFKMLPAAISKLSDGGNEIKKTFPSLAFLSDWPDESLRLFFEQLESSYIIAYLLMAPQMQNRVIKLIPGKSATIIVDELKIGNTLAPKVLDEKLQFLKARLYKLVNDEVISLEQIFGNKNNGSKLKVA